LELISPKKSLGQNFLTDKNISNKIVEALGAEDGDIALEIGPGPGALTGLLLEKPLSKLYAVELDKRAVELLTNKFPAASYPNFNLIHSDIRAVNIKELAGDVKIKTIGNIPYYISADILFLLFHSAEYIENTIIMVQKEVAKRICAKPGSKDYGIISIAAALVGYAKIAFDVPPSCFFPAPKVTSSVVKIEYSRNYPEDIKFDKLMKFVKAAFSQRRKTLRNSLKTYFSDYDSEKVEAFYKDKEKTLTLRAEVLTPQDFIQLYSDFHSSIEG
jgi:16S rRNA (adenine1518-N6/adenine1519-N6)-dimethyltransferase